MKKILYAAIPLLLLVVLAEVTLRVASWYMLKSRQPKAAVERAGWIGCYGDSWTYGLGVADLATYPAALERGLKKAGLADAVVVNRGVPGAGVDAVEKDIGTDLDSATPPSLALILVGVNDLERFSRIANRATRREAGPGAPRSALERIRLVRIIRHFVAPKKRIVSPAAPSVKGASSKGYEDRLEALISRVQAKGAVPVILTYPMPMHAIVPREPLRHDLIFLNLAQRLAAIDRNAPLVDLQPPFDAQPGDGPWLSMYDTHPNARGNALIAATLVPVVAGLLGKKIADSPEPEEVMVTKDSAPVRLPTHARISAREAVYEVREQPDGSRIVESDTDEDGEVDYRAVFQNDRIVHLDRTNAEKGTYEQLDFLDGVLRRARVRYADGLENITWYEWDNPTTLFLFHYSDKDKDGVFDHYEQWINDVLLTRLLDDNDQDGRWEYFSLIDQQGRVYMQVGDRDGDGRLDFWELRRGKTKLFQSLDSDGDGLPDEPLLEMDRFDLEVLPGLVLKAWADQREKIVHESAPRIRRITNVAPDGARRINETWDDELVRSIILATDGGVDALWYERQDAATRFFFRYNDKNRDGVIDHMEEWINERLMRRRDDDDQDGDWQVRTVIDDQGNAYMHVGDRDGDGRTDFWELRRGQTKLFQTLDSDGDGLPDEPLPELDRFDLGVLPELVLKAWADQHEKIVHESAPRIRRVTNVAPDGRRRINETWDDELVRSTTFAADGGIDALWYERLDASTRFFFRYNDKDRDGVIDHMEEWVNERLVRRRDDDNQDGRWEIWAVIDDQGNAYMHLGDIDGDGRVDFWELFDGEESLFKALDTDRDGLPDEPLPLFDALGVAEPHPDTLTLWGNQKSEVLSEKAPRILRVSHRGPKGNTRVAEYWDGQLVRSTARTATGQLVDEWFERSDQGVRFLFRYEDKNGDGVIDHMEEFVDNRLVRRRDDDDQDGRWEVGAMIDEQGNAFMHLGDIDGDGRVDFWELFDGENSLFKTLDTDRDGLPDEPLPPFDVLGVADPHPDTLTLWGNQKSEVINDADPRILRVAHRGPKGNTRVAEYWDGQLLRSTARTATGQLVDEWFELSEQGTRFLFRYEDKNGDGVIDHMEEFVDNRLVRRRDDDDQDGRWEVGAMIDEQGNAFMHLGDIDGDGDPDFWELFDGENSLFKTLDTDRDGLPDEPLPPFDVLGVADPHPDTLSLWGNQKSEVINDADPRILRVAHRGPKGNTRVAEYWDGQLVRSTARTAEGSLADEWFELSEQGTRFLFRYEDKNGDGVIDHLEEFVDNRLVRRRDDDDQDGRWEVEAVIDEQGNAFMHLGDIDGDGRVDFWELFDGEKSLFKTLDSDRDGLVDEPLPSFEALGVAEPHPDTLMLWGNQKSEVINEKAPRIVRVTHRGPDKSTRANDYEDGRLARSTTTTEKGAITVVGYEQGDEGTRFVFRYEDKNGDGVIDHMEEFVNDRLVRRRDDDDQDGRWEVWAVIDDQGNAFLHLGDIDGDGRVDFWELFDGEKSLFRSNDSDRDGQPDRALPPLSKLGLKTRHPDLPRLWSGDAGKWIPADQPRAQTTGDTDAGAKDEDAVPREGADQDEGAPCGC